MGLEWSKPIRYGAGERRSYQICRDGDQRMSSDIARRDVKGRLISKGTHRDLKSVR